MDESLIDGSKVKVDENYVSESIKYPNAKVVAGYGPVSKMQTFEGKLSNQDIDFLIAYMKHLKQPGSGDAVGGAAPAAATPAAAEPKQESAPVTQEPAAQQPAAGAGSGG